MTPTARNLRHLREAGWHVAVVEMWIPRTFIRRDAFGWADVLAVHSEQSGALLVQVTTGSHAANRAAKARGNPALVAWLVAGNRLTVHGWRKLKGRWVVAERSLRVEEVVTRDNRTDGAGGRR